MARISFALFQAFIGGASITEIADRLQLPETWVQERIEAARLCLLFTSAG
jgi:DNA-binding Lrp family transcriptional regulator